MLGEVVDLTRTLFDADKAGLWLVDEGEYPFKIAAHHGLSDAFLERVAALRGDEDTIGYARRPRAAPVFGPQRGHGRRRSERCSVRLRGATASIPPASSPWSAATQPSACSGSTTAATAAGRRRRWPWSQAFADQAAVAIQNARLYRSVADQAARMRSIQDLSARLNRLSDVRAIAEAIVAEASALADYHDIRVYAVDWERRMCDPIAFTREMLDGDPADAEALLRVAIGEGFTGWVAEHGEPLLINDALDDERGKTIEGTEDMPESMLLVPMLYEGRALRRHRAQPARLQPLHDRRPPDDEHLRRLRGAGDRQRDDLRPARRAVNRAPPASGLSAPPARDQRAPARHARPGGRARDDRGRPARGRRLRQPVHLSGRHAAARDDAGADP